MGLLLSTACLGGDELEVAQTSQEAGTATLSVSATAPSVNAGGLLSFELDYSINNAPLDDVVITFSMDDLNDLGDGDDTGLAGDAEHDYGSGVFDFRPLEFEAASTGPGGVIPSTPAAGATTGAVTWTVGTLPDGFTGQVQITVRVPTGYLAGKVINGRATLTATDNDEVPPVPISLASTTLTPVDTTATEDYTMRNNPLTGLQPPGATNVVARFGLRNLDTALTTMDAEDITITVNSSSSTCTPTITEARFIRVGTFPAKYSFQDPVSLANPISGHIDRVPYNVNEGQIYLLVVFDIPATCVDGEQVVLAPTTTLYGGTKTLNGPNVTVDVGAELCRNTATRAFRTQSGLLPPDDPDMNNYNEWPTPAPQDNYVANGSVRPGEYVNVMTPLGTGATQTVVLDRTYYHYTIPEGVSFHGLRSYSFLGDAGLGIHGAYKDCDGDALAPNDAMFNHIDPEMSGWNQVQKNWTGPFSAMSNDAMANTVVSPGCELLFIKVFDSPAGTPPDNGAWQVRSIFQVCDGTHCPIDSNLSTPINTDNGFTYTVADAMAPSVNTCGMPNPGGHRFFVATESYPIIKVTPRQGVVAAGAVVQIDMNPGNVNLASEFTDGKWYMDLFPIKDQIGLDGVLGQVVTTEADAPAFVAEYPKAGQNVPTATDPLGCSPIADITYHPPNSATCNAAGDPGCFAWFEVPDRCQPPNGYWGSGVSVTQNEHLQYLRFRLSVPVNFDVPPGTQLNFTADVREQDGVTPGADNAAPISRWPESNYSDTGTVNVLSNPDAQVFKTGPVAWPDGSEMFYTLEAVNEGNVSLSGIYLIDEMPRMGTNGSQFTPVYRRVYSDRSAAEVAVESTTDAGCFSNSPAITWTPVGSMEATAALPGYLSRTNVDVPAGALCIRVHLTGGASLAPGASMFAAVGVEIPAGTAGGMLLGNRALVASAAGLNGETVSLDPGLSNVLVTEVATDPVVVVEKSFEIDPTREGYIKWILRYYNASGVMATNAVVTDTLPNNATYAGLASPLDAGETCTDGDDGMGNCNTSMGGTELRFTIASLAPFDGAEGSGADEGTVEIWTVNNGGLPAGTTIENCGNATPTTATPPPDGCASTSTVDFNMTKTITGSPTVVNIGDTLEYVMTATNTTAGLLFITMYDQLPADVSFEPGTLIINSSQASDTIMNGNELSYTQAMDPGETLEVRLTVRVNGPMTGGTIGNIAVGSGCTNPLSPATCVPAEASTEVQVMVPSSAVCGDGAVEGTEECDTMGESMTCDADCTFVACGDNTTNMMAGEECDDGNTAPSDGCQPNCLLPACGDSYLDAGEGCDDNNTMGGDNCSATCLIEDGNSCNITLPGSTGDTSCDSGICDTTGNPAPGVCEPADTCGNGVLEGMEECDDGNTIDGDGCQSTCLLPVCGDGTVDVGEECDDGNMTSGDACQPDCELPACGDTYLDPNEGCDDGNNLPGDGCNDSCLLENGQGCNGTAPGQMGDMSCESGNCDTVGNPAPGVCEPLDTCGNGIMEGMEECDDGNTIDGDGTCQGNCLLPVCGDGIEDPGEACDDGNMDNNDACLNTCMLPGCGDGVLAIGEGCDDMNNMDGDGCTSTCELEDGEMCNDMAPGNTGDTSCDSGVCDTTGNPAPGVCEPALTCGNGVTDVGEECDDGNIADGDGTCQANCLLPVCGDGIMDPGEECDDGNTMDGDTCQSTCTLPACGDGVLGAGEGCDDGNNTDGDNCTATCRIEDGIACNDTAPGDTGDTSCDSGICDTMGNPAPGVCEPADTCGNGVAEGAEECDDGNTDDADGCAADCTVEVTCGNGTLDADEGCDDGNADDADGCNMDCLIEDGNDCNADMGGMTGNGSCASGVCDDSGNDAPGVCEPAMTCGNGAVEDGEVCDDGNTDDGDDCPADCVGDPGAVCGNGLQEMGEECDDGNDNDGDGCSSTCTDEGFGVTGGACSATSKSGTSTAWLVLFAFLGSVLIRRRRREDEVV